MQDLTDTFLDNRDFRRIARAIRFIDGNFRRQPRLATIAAEAGLSEFHFNRLFKRWAGVTPRQYLAFVTARAARGALARSASVLEASYAVGLSGPGRLHDLMVTLDGVTPGELKAGGSGLTIRYGFTRTPFGDALIACTARGVCHLGFPASGAERSAVADLQTSWPRAQLVRDDAAAREWALRIWAAPAGGATPVKLAVKGTNFQLKVWQALLEAAQAPTSYTGVARAAGLAGAERAVANAVGANPVAWLIPCHNVLRKDGTLGGYHWGEDRKRAMLAWRARDIMRAEAGGTPTSEASRRATA
ncbi:MAG TPA: bifunctional helix-turn-helix domain-containing protein/methylated-DNA--[protein]-cysteine S-methyltransferase [Steroidobacteraceae bacterium]|jgi:AraC family transcriptional regulator of adaptative response/methylated-DNA-[protein]-cysteine methyltransferase|nr:bifunctional helix-turn-helix domain-containing protein/methylated-DNA--[protein]-cysteine S-methyltransferase [Steroidobacteraceae bacterium]